jgi:hypothetical protein
MDAPLRYDERQREKIGAEIAAATLQHLNTLALLLEKLKANKQIERASARFVETCIGLRYVKIATETKNKAIRK